MGLDLNISEDLTGSVKKLRQNMVFVIQREKLFFYLKKLKVTFKKNDQK